ncbi:hypothetical protein EIP86_005551 [Pleurotus ostreatoroseus]|nr:hypothetical protein EIP86_005551 [Pleurotus ostreatoroseus]
MTDGDLWNALISKAEPSLGSPACSITEIDMLSWMGRTALELVGQGGLGYSFDPLVANTHNDFGEAIKTFL